MQVTEINGEMGKVEIGGVSREVGLMLLEDIRIGDWVIVHAGIAISKINDQEAEETLKLLKEGGMI
jgi:hydrogenase expression/formation protein HypC